MVSFWAGGNFCAEFFLKFLLYLNIHFEWFFVKSYCSPRWKIFLILYWMVTSYLDDLNFAWCVYFEKNRESILQKSFDLEEWVILVKQIISVTLYMLINLWNIWTHFQKIKFNVAGTYSFSAVFAYVCNLLQITHLQRCFWYAFCFWKLSDWFPFKQVFGIKYVRIVTSTLEFYFGFIY